MTHVTTAAHRLPLLAAATLALALLLALGIASPAAGFVDDTAAPQPTEDTTAQPTQNTGFDAEGPGFIDSGTDDEHNGAAADGADAHTGDEAAPTGGVSAGFGGLAASEAGLGALHAVAAGLLALVALGLGAHRRLVPVRS